jgi:hypothetical protein
MASVDELCPDCGRRCNTIVEYLDAIRPVRTCHLRLEELERGTVLWDADAATVGARSLIGQLLVRMLIEPRTNLLPEP